MGAVSTGFKHVSSAVKQGHEFLTLFMVEQVQPYEMMGNMFKMSGSMHNFRREEFAIKLGKSSGTKVSWMLKK